MKLGFDIDGITADMTKMMVERLNKIHGIECDERIFVNHSIEENTYVEDSDKNMSIALDLIENIVENKTALIEIDPYEEAILAIRKLSKSGHTIHHITSRAAAQKDVTVDWLRKHSIPFDSVHVIGNSGVGGNRVSKGKLGRSLNLDFYIDDCIWHLDDMYRYKNRWRKGIGLFTQPWNKNEIIDPGKYIRFDSWKEIIRHVGIHKR